MSKNFRLLSFLTPAFPAVLAAVILCASCYAQAQIMSPQGPDEAPPVAFLSVQGQGLAPNAVVTLSTGPQQQLSATADQNGSVAFANLKYSPGTNLVFALAFKISEADSKQIDNMIKIDLDPFTGSVRVEGNATRAASVIINVSSEDSNAMVANQKGYFSGRADSLSGMSDGNVKVIASIINVQEDCCPRSLKPLLPATFTISSQQIKKAANLIEENTTFSSEVVLPVIRAGVSVPPALINDTWVNGLYNFANRVGEGILSQTASWGAFFDAQANLNARRALQEGAAQAAKDEAPSEALCRFGSLSQSLVASDANADVNKLAFDKALRAREMGTKGMLGSNGDSGTRQMEDYINFYCDPQDNNLSLENSCKSKAKDSRYNLDINYTRVVDTPMTLNVNFARTGSTAATSDEQNIFALAENLFPSQPLKKTFDRPDYLHTSGLYRSLQAIRAVAKSTFVTLVADKSSGTAGSQPFIIALMKAMGVSSGTATSLMGANPSYYAQMEALTKKLYQDPAFYVNLVDTPANVDRQRAAIRAIKLQQQQDLADTVKRREMLLALLLELKLRERAHMVNQRVTNSSN